METIPVIVENDSGNQNSNDNLHLNLPTTLQLVKQDGNDPMLSLSMATVANTTQSVITSNHQSVIQAPLSNGEGNNGVLRREILSRRPSYRRILNELSEPSESNQDNLVSGIKMEVVAEVNSEEDEQDSPENNLGYQSNTVTIQQSPQTIQITAPMNQTDPNNMQTFTVANALSQAQIVQQSDGSGNAIWMPGGHVVVQGASGDMQTYQIRSPGSNNLTSVVSSGNNLQSPQQMAEEASRKRELRLLKNREAARDCRRKKKEYIKCLENRVHVLETQNKALIDELKTLKEMYCSKDNM